MLPIIDFLASIHIEEAIEDKDYGLLEGEYGYHQDNQELLEFIETQLISSFNPLMSLIRFNLHLNSTKHLTVF